MVYVSGLLQVNSLSLNRAQCEEFTDYIMLMLKKQPSIDPKNMNTYNILELFDDK